MKKKNNKKTPKKQHNEYFYNAASAYAIYPFSSYR